MTTFNAADAVCDLSHYWTWVTQLDTSTNIHALIFSNGARYLNLKLLLFGDVFPHCKDHHHRWRPITAHSINFDMSSPFSSEHLCLPAPSLALVALVIVTCFVCKDETLEKHWFSFFCAVLLRSERFVLLKWVSWDVHLATDTDVFCMDAIVCPTLALRALLFLFARSWGLTTLAVLITALYHHHHHQQQQSKLSVASTGCYWVALACSPFWELIQRRRYMRGSWCGWL